MPRKRKEPTAGTPERLQKILSRAGLASRRRAEELIRTGRVRVNGRTVTELGARADPRRDRILVDGRPLRLPTSPIYILLNKPAGVVTTMADPAGRRTVRDLLQGLGRRVYPVGRLDYHSSGLLLLTDDGELAARLMHPRHGVPKVYRVKVRGVPGPEQVRRLSEGVELEDGRTAPAVVRVESVRAGKAWLRIRLREGRNRQIRRMCAAVGLPVEKLSRVRLGPLRIGRLAPGQWRELSQEEVARLREAAGLAAPGAGGRPRPA